MVHQKPTANQQPTGNAWRSLAREGVVWEGHVLVLGGDTGLQARMILTPSRLALANAGDVFLEVPRIWLRPEPALNGDGALVLSIWPEDDEAAESIIIGFRDPRFSASDVLDFLVGPGGDDGSAPLPPLASSTVPASVPGTLVTMKRNSWTSTLVELTDADAALFILNEDDFPPLGPASVMNGGRREAVPFWTERTRVATSAPVSAMPTSRNWNLDPASANRGSGHSRHRIVRVGSLVLLILSFATFGLVQLTDVSLPNTNTAGTSMEIEAASPVADDTANAKQQTVPTANASVTLPALTPRDAAVVFETPSNPADQTAVARGVGGQATDLPTAVTTETSLPLPKSTPKVNTTGVRQRNQVSILFETPDPTEFPVGEKTDPVTNNHPVATESTETEAPVAETAPTETPAIETPTPESAPTETPASEGQAIDPMATEAAPTEVPTEVPAPTETPVPTAVPTETPLPTEVPTQAPTPTAAPVPGELGQVPTVNENSTPAQVMVAAQMRYTILAADRAAEFADLGLAWVEGTEWVVVVVDARNWSETDATVNVADFRILTYAPYVVFAELSDQTGAVAAALDLDPAYGAYDSATYTSGEHHRIALAFQVGADVSSMALVTGDYAAELTASLSGSQTVTSVGKTPAMAKLVRAEVTGIVDGQTIQVTVDGEAQLVRFAGITAPVADACYAGDAVLEANWWVGGKVVYLEREASDVDADGALIRDVWIPNEDGTMTLAAVALVETGAATPNLASPDSRYQAHLIGAAKAAEQAGVGLWGNCAITSTD